MSTMLVDTQNEASYSRSSYAWNIHKPYEPRHEKTFLRPDKTQTGRSCPATEASESKVLYYLYYLSSE